MHVVSLDESLFQSVRVASTIADGAMVLNFRKKSLDVWAAAADAPSKRHEQIGATTRNRVSTGVFSYLVREIMLQASRPGGIRFSCRGSFQSWRACPALSFRPRHRATT